MVNSVKVRAADLIKMSSFLLAMIDIDKMYEIAAAVHANRDLIKSRRGSPRCC